MTRFQFTLIPLCLSLLLTSACMALESRRVPLSETYKHGDQYMQAQLKGMLKLPRTLTDGTAMEELSGLAWDKDESILYAISDMGMLFHLQPQFRNGQLIKLNVLANYPLKLPLNKKGKHPSADTEGLVVRNATNGRKGDTELLISLEGKPQIILFTPSGQTIGTLSLPSPINDRKRYDSGNRGLEAVTEHPAWGVITTPETPLTGTPTGEYHLYTLSGGGWKIPSLPYEGNSIVALESLADGSLLTLERRITSPLQPIIITLRKIWLTSDCRLSAARLCRNETIAQFNSADGWQLDNFEGLTHHENNHFFLVSDNNQFWMQRTLLMYIELLPEGSSSKDHH